MAILEKEGSPPIDVSSPDAYKQAIADGYTPRDDVVTLTNERGEPRDFAVGDVDLMFDQRAGVTSDAEAQQRRIEQELENEYGGTAEQFRTFGEGALSTATLGLYDAAAAVLGEEEGIAKRQAQNPGSRMAGEITGIVGPALLTGGVGAVGTAARLTPVGASVKAATAVGKNVGGGLKGAVAAGVVEGAAQGAGAAISNLALNDVPLTVESVVSEVGMNTLLGAGFGGLGGAGGYGLVNAGGKLLSKAEAAQAGLARAEMSMAKETLGTVSKSTKQAFREIDTIAPKLLSQADDVSAGFGMSLDSVALQNSKNVLTQKAAQLRSRGHTLGQGQRLVNKMDDAQAKFLSAVKANDDKLIRETLEDFHTRINVLNDKIDLPSQALPPSLLGVSQKIKYTKPEGFDDIYKAAKSAYVDATESGLTKDPMKTLLASETVEELFENAGKLDRLTKSLQQLDGLAGEGKYAAQLIDPLEKMSLKATEALGEKGSEMSLVAMAGLFGVEEVLIPDIPGPLDDVLKFALAVKFAKSAGVVSASGKASTFIKGLVNTSTRRAARNAGWQAGSGGLAGSVKATVYEGIAGKAINAAMGSSRSMQRATSNMGIRLNRAFGKILKGSGKLSKGTPVITGLVLRDTNFSDKPLPKNETKVQAFHRITDDISTLASSESTAAQRIHDNLAPIRVGSMAVGDAMYGHLIDTVGFLNQRMPRDPGRLQHFGKSKWRPSEAEMDRMAKLIAATDSGAAIERLAEGRMTREDAEALRVLKPATFQQIQNFLIDNLDGLQSLGYEHRIHISTLMGVEADPVVSRTKVWQETFLKAAEDQAQPQMGGTAAKPTPGTTAQQLSGSR